MLSGDSRRCEKKLFEWHGRCRWTLGSAFLVESQLSPVLCLHVLYILRILAEFFQMLVAEPRLGCTQGLAP